MSISIGGKIVTDGLIVHLDALNRRSYPGSGADWNDLTVYNNTGSLDVGDDFNPVTITNGYAILDSSDLEIVGVTGITEINTATQYLTVDMWARVSSDITDVGTANPFLCGISRYGISFEVIGGGDGTPLGKFGFATTDLGDDVYGIDNLSYITGSLVNKWNHYTFVMCTGSISSGSQKIYINSTPLALSQVAGSDDNTKRQFVFSGEGLMYFGTRGNGATTRTTNADVAMIKIYNRELTQAEVTQNFNAHKGRFNIY